MFAELMLLAALGCPGQPAAPEQTEAWAVQVTDTAWRTEVPGWFEVPGPTCWMIGRVELEYHGASTPQVSEPGPWLEGSDYPMGATCPAEAPAGCIPSPNKPRPPPPGCTSEFCTSN